MSSTPRVVLILSPAAGYDRGLLRGIAATRIITVPGCSSWRDQPGVPIPLTEALPTQPGNISRVSSLDLRGLKANGVIGRVETPKVAKAVLASRLPVVAMDLTDQQLSADSPWSRVSEVRPDSHKAGRLAADHLLERGFRRFSFCGFPGENWSRSCEQGFVERLREAGFDCDSFESPKQRRGHALAPGAASSRQVAQVVANAGGALGVTTSADAK